MARIFKVVRPGKKKPHDEMFSKITPMEAATLIEDVNYLGQADDLLQKVSDQGVSVNGDRHEGYMELRAIRERIKTLKRRISGRLARDFYA